MASSCSDTIGSTGKKKNTTTNAVEHISLWPSNEELSNKFSNMEMTDRVICAGVCRKKFPFGTWIQRKAKQMGKVVPELKWLPSPAPPFLLSRAGIRRTNFGNSAPPAPTASEIRSWRKRLFGLCLRVSAEPCALLSSWCPTDFTAAAVTFEHGNTALVAESPGHCGRWLNPKQG